MPCHLSRQLLRQFIASKLATVIYSPFPSQKFGAIIFFGAIYAEKQEELM